MHRDPDSTHAAESPSPTPNPFGGFRKKTYRLGELLGHLAALVARTPGILAVWGRKRVEPMLREEIMVAVARTNGCRFCNFVHGQWALSRGLSEEGLDRIGRAAGSGQEPEHALALAYAQSLASSGFGPVPGDVEQRTIVRYGETMRQDIETVARVMTVANLSANTVDALLSRFRGVPSGHSRVIDELVISAGFFLVYPLMMGVLAVMQRRSPLAVYRDFVQSQQTP